MSKPRELPIIFSCPMVRAILDGRKTQTRRADKSGGTKPRYAVGDLLWVRETWAEYGHCNDGPVYAYRADHDRTPPSRWNPSIHMRKEVARIWLRVLDVRIERIQEITEEDALAEGVASRDGFIELWEAIHGRGAWEQNNWVWVYEFERVEVPNA